MNKDLNKGIKLIKLMAINIPIALLTLFSIFPVVWMIYSSIKTEQEFALSVISLPTSFQFENYLNAFRTARMNIAFINSFIASSLTVVLVVVLGSVTGIIFGRYSFKFKDKLYTMFLLGLLIPVYALLVPVFIEMKMLGMLGNIYAISLLYTAFNLPIAIFLISSYAKKIPQEIEEASIIDGAGFNTIFFRIMLPICVPSLGTVLILTFLNAWNEFPFALVLLNKNTMTVPIGLTYFSGMYSVNYTELMAGLSLAILPVIIIYFAFYKKVVASMIAGAVKG